MIKKFELSKEDQKILYNFAKKIKIDFISSAFDLISLDFLINDLDLKILKIPSGEITNFPYLKKISNTKKILYFQQVCQALRKYKKLFIYLLPVI